MERKNILGVVHTPAEKIKEHNLLLREKFDQLVSDKQLSKEKADIEYRFWSLTE